MVKISWRKGQLGRKTSNKAPRRAIMKTRLRNTVLEANHGPSTCESKGGGCPKEPVSQGNTAGPSERALLTISLPLI